MIACVLIPHFAIAIERRARPALRDVPLVLGRTAGRSSKVYDSSAEAEACGVRPGMTLRQAEALCPNAHVLPAAPPRYREALVEMAEILAGHSPCVELGALEPAATSYLELGSLAGLQAVAEIQQLAQALRQRAGLSPAIGVATGKFPAHVAALHLAVNEALLIGPGMESDFLAPLPVDLLPMDAELARRLKLLGLRTLGQLAALPTSALQTQLGSQASLLHRLAQGRDDAPLRPYVLQSVERITQQFDGAVADWGILEATLGKSAATLAERLRVTGQAAQEMRLALHLEDGACVEREIAFREPVCSRAHLARALSELLLQARAPCGVTEIEVELSGLRAAQGQQLDLFAHGDGGERQLHLALADLSRRYGADAFWRIALLDQGSRLPERRFHLQEVAEP